MAAGVPPQTVVGASCPDTSSSPTCDVNTVDQRNPTLGIPCCNAVIRDKIPCGEAVIRDCIRDLREIRGSNLQPSALPLGVRISGFLRFVFIRFRKRKRGCRHLPTTPLRWEKLTPPRTDHATRRRRRRRPAPSSRPARALVGSGTADHTSEPVPPL